MEFGLLGPVEVVINDKPVAIAARQQIVLAPLRDNKPHGTLALRFATRSHDGSRGGTSIRRPRHSAD
jgi:hypothetical protein